MKYHEQIKHPLWQKKRLEVLQAQNFECQHCGSTENQLHVHHPFYKRGAMIWEYETDDLVCLCDKCHKKAHVVDERLKKLLAYASNCEKWFFCGYLEAIDCQADELYIENYEHAAGIGAHFYPPLSSEQVQNLSRDYVVSVQELFQLSLKLRRDNHS